MERTSGVSLDRKLLVVMILICLALGGGFALVYLNLRTDFANLKDDYANLSARMEQLQSILDALHLDQTAGLTAVQIYNLTKYSVVLVTNTRADSVVEGSGFVYDMQGHIVTNNHVVDGAVSLTVTFLDGTVEQAQRVGTDVYSDLAVISVDSLPDQAHPLVLGNSSELMVGEPVWAIGNPFRLSGSMTAGIVSQLGRVLRLSDLGVPPPMGNYSIVDVVQSDAAVNPGNSGGALLDSLGRVVGVTFAIETAGSTQGFVGVGYAIPSVLVSRVVPSLIATGSYHHPYLGIEFTDMTPDLAATLHTNYTTGALVVSVVAGGPADQAGLHSNDIIIRVDTVNVSQSDMLPIYLERYKSPNDVITLRIVRNNVSMNLNLTLGERPT
jgi:S1-C subfamily serine protease